MTYEQASKLKLINRSDCCKPCCWCKNIGEVKQTKTGTYRENCKLPNIKGFSEDVRCFYPDLNQKGTPYQQGRFLIYFEPDETIKKKYDKVMFDSKQQELNFG